MKKLLSMTLIGCILLTPIPTNAAPLTTGLTDDKVQIESVVEEFFSAYENVDCNKSTKQIMDELKNVSSVNLAEQFMGTNTKNNAECNYLEMAELLLQRKEIIENNSDIDLTEYEKVLEITENEITVNEKEAEAKISVTKTWNYVFSPDIKSGATDDYVIHLNKESQE